MENPFWMAPTLPPTKTRVKVGAIRRKRVVHRYKKKAVREPLVTTHRDLKIKSLKEQ